MPKQDSRRNKQRNRATRASDADDAFLEHEALFDDELRLRLEKEQAKGKKNTKREDVLAGQAPIRSNQVGKIKDLKLGQPIAVVVSASGADMALPAAQDPPEPPDDWEDWVDGVIEQHATGSPAVAVFDIGSGERGVSSAIEAGRVVHCLCPIALPHDLGRQYPEIPAQSEVTRCDHALKDCCCLPVDGLYLGISKQSIYYLDQCDLSRFQAGDRLLAEYKTYDKSQGRRPEGLYEVRDATNPVTGNAVRVVKAWTKNRPWEAYYHTEVSGMSQGIRIADDFYAYPTIVSWKSGVVRATFHFVSQRLGWGEFDSRDSLTFGMAKRLFETAGPSSQAATATHSAAMQDDLPDQCSDMGGVSQTTTAPPLNAVNVIGSSTPVAAVAASGKDEVKEVRETLRALLSGQEGTGGPKQALTVLASVQRKFRNVDPKVIAATFRSELPLVRDAQLAVADAASQETQLVKALNGDKPTLGARVLTTLTGGEGEVVGEVKRRLKRPFKNRQDLISAVRGVNGGLEPNQ